MDLEDATDEITVELGAEGAVKDVAFNVADFVTCEVTAEEDRMDIDDAALEEVADTSRELVRFGLEAAVEREIG